MFALPMLEHEVVAARRVREGLLHPTCRRLASRGHRHGKIIPSLRWARILPLRSIRLFLLVDCDRRRPFAVQRRYFTRNALYTRTVSRSSHRSLNIRADIRILRDPPNGRDRFCAAFGVSPAGNPRRSRTSRPDAIAAVSSFAPTVGRRRIEGGCEVRRRVVE